MSCDICVVTRSESVVKMKSWFRTQSDRSSRQSETDQIVNELAENLNNLGSASNPSEAATSQESEVIARCNFSWESSRPPEDATQNPPVSPSDPRDALMQQAMRAARGYLTQQYKEIYENDEGNYRPVPMPRRLRRIDSSDDVSSEASFHSTMNDPQTSVPGGENPFHPMVDSDLMNSFLPRATSTQNTRKVPDPSRPVPKARQLFFKKTSDLPIIMSGIKNSPSNPCDADNDTDSECSQEDCQLSHHTAAYLRRARSYRQPRDVQKPNVSSLRGQRPRPSILKDSKKLRSQDSIPEPRVSFSDNDQEFFIPRGSESGHKNFSQSSSRQQRYPISQSVRDEPKKIKKTTVTKCRSPNHTKELYHVDDESSGCLSSDSDEEELLVPRHLMKDMRSFRSFAGGKNAHLTISGFFSELEASLKTNIPKSERGDKTKLDKTCALILKSHLTGEALDFFSSQTSSVRHSYKKIKREMMQRYADTVDPDFILHKLNSLHQGEMPVSALKDKVNHLVEVLLKTDDTLKAASVEEKKGQREFLLKTHFFKALNADIYHQMSLEGRPKSFESACERAISIETALRASRAHQGAGFHTGQRKMHALSRDPRKRNRNRRQNSSNITDSVPQYVDVNPTCVSASVDMTRPPPNVRGSVTENVYTTHPPSAPL